MKLLTAIIFSLACVVAGAVYLGTARHVDPEYQSLWRPLVKTVLFSSNASSSSSSSSVLPDASGFYALHGDAHNSDELAVAASRSLALDWTVEKDFFIAEGPTQDRQGNLYFSPIDPQENVMLVSLDGNTGERRWSIPASATGVSRGGGAPLILNAPQPSDKQRAEQQVIYLSIYERAVAVTTDGEILWDVKPDLPDYSVTLGEPDERHVFGLNYHPQFDALVGLTASGHIFVLDRRTGKSLLQEPYALAGRAAKSEVVGRPGKWISDRVDRVMDSVFGASPNQVGRFTAVVNALFGEGAEVSNFFAIDRHSGRLFVAASAPDDVDGTVDGYSEYGALYALDLVRVSAGEGEDESKGKVVVLEVARQDFKGGSGASPALSADGSKVYTADNKNQVLAFDRNLKPIWRIDVGQTIAASISVSSENNELYAVSMQKIFKLIDEGDSASLVWEATLDIYPELGPYRNFNMTTPTITANGIAVVVGAGLANEGFTLPFKMGSGLLDRQTGELLSYTPTREESVSVTMVSRDGGYYLAHSPIRRSVSRALLGPLVKPLVGGVSRYRVEHPQRLVADIACAVKSRREAAEKTQDDLQRKAFLDHVTLLLKQAEHWGKGAAEILALEKGC